MGWAAPEGYRNAGWWFIDHVPSSAYLWSNLCPGVEIFHICAAREHCSLPRLQLLLVAVTGSEANQNDSKPLFPVLGSRQSFPPSPPSAKGPNQMMSSCTMEQRDQQHLIVSHFSIVFHSPFLNNFQTVWPYKNNTDGSSAKELVPQGSWSCCWNNLCLFQGFSFHHPKLQFVHCYTVESIYHFMYSEARSSLLQLFA